MNKISALLSFFMCSLSLSSFAQEKKNKADTVEVPGIVTDIMMTPLPEMLTQGEVFVHVEEMPAFPGGSDKMYAFIQKNKQYPQKGPDADKEGKVFVSFIVKSDGSLQNIEVKRGLSPSHDAEAIKIIKMMPKWIPAKQNGKPVNCWYTLPIAFYFLQ